MSVMNAVANASAHQAILQMKSRIEQSKNTISDIETQISTTNDKIMSTRNEHDLTAKQINVLYQQILNTWKSKHGNSKDVHDKVIFFQNTTKKMLTNSTEVCRQLSKKVLTFKRENDEFTKETQGLPSIASKMSAIDTDYKLYKTQKQALKEKQTFAANEMSRAKELTGKLQDMEKNLHHLRSENFSLLPKIDKILKEEARLELQRDTKKEQLLMLKSTIQSSTAKLQKLEISVKECNGLRSTKDSIQKTLGLYNRTLKASCDARFHLRDLLKSISEIEETENYLSKTLIPKYEKVIRKNKSMDISRKSIEKKYDEVKQQVEKVNLKLSVAERRYKSIEQYDKKIKQLNLHNYINKCNKVKNDILAARNFKKAIRSQLFLENGNPVIGIDKITEKINKLQRLTVPQDIVDENNAYKTGQMPEDSRIFGQVLQHINVSVPFNDSQNSAVTAALNGSTQRDLMNLCVETSLLQARELEKQKFLRCEMTSGKYEKQSIALLEARINELENETVKIETEYKILWECVKHG